MHTTIAARATDVVVWTNYKNLLLNLDIAEVHAADVNVKTEEGTLGAAWDSVRHEENGSVLLSGGVIRLDVVPNVEGFLAIHYDQQRDQYSLVFDNHASFWFSLSGGATVHFISGVLSSFKEEQHNIPYGPGNNRVYLSEAGPNTKDNTALPTTWGRDSGFIDNKLILIAHKQARSTLVLREAKGKSPRFVEPSVYHETDFEQEPGSRLISGTIQFQSIPGSQYVLRPEESFSIDDTDGVFKSLRLEDGSINLYYTSNANHVIVGELGSPVAIVPSYLDYVKSRPFINSVYAATASVLGIVLGLIGWWSGRR
jgi:hypothetical protein